MHLLLPLPCANDTGPSFQHPSLCTELDLISVEALTLRGPVHLGPRWLLLSCRVNPQNDEYAGARRELMRDTAGGDGEEEAARERDKRENGREREETEDFCLGFGRKEMDTDGEAGARRLSALKILLLLRLLARTTVPPITAAIDWVPFHDIQFGTSALLMRGARVKSRSGSRRFSSDKHWHLPSHLISSGLLCCRCPR